MKIEYNLLEPLAVRSNSMLQLERKLYVAIKDLYQEIKDMYPADGFSSPRDITLVTEINKKFAILDHMQNAMRVINPGFEIREN